LLTEENLQNNDPERMHEIYDKWAEIANDAYNSELESIDFKNIDHVVFSGMGGSGTVGDIFSSILSKKNIHTTVVKGYILPETVDKNTLVVITSVSGNTIETISTLESASKKNCQIIAFSAGGKIESFCLKNNIEFRKILEIHSPRASLPNYIYSILKTLNSIFPISEKEIIESIDALKIISKLISSKNLSHTNISLELANWIDGVPIIYYPWGLEATAIRFKNSLQENAKSHVFMENIIESGHNGIVSWERSSNMIPILIEGIDDHPKTKERWNIISQYFEQNNIEYKEIHSVTGGILSKIMCLIFVLDYASIYYAIRLGVDPTPIKSINFIKEKL
jgi:glucose/mannose-6-phosphate isomerase